MINCDTIEYGGRSVLIMGGLGFIGSNLALALQANGAEVTLLATTWPKNDLYLHPSLREMHLCLGDMADAKFMAGAVQGAEIIFNLAARAGATASNASPLDDWQKNCAPQLTFLEACRMHNPHARVVYASSRLVYSPRASQPVVETAPVAPISFYGIHKLAVEKYHQLYYHLCGLESVILRITNPYGSHQKPGMRGYGVVNWFIQQAAEGKDIPIYGEGHQLRDYLFIDDLIDVLLRAGTIPAAKNRIYNIGSGAPIRLVDMAGKVISLARKGQIKHVPWPEDALKAETGDFYANIAAARSELGWSPNVSLDDGIARAVNYYRQSLIGPVS